MNEHTIIYTKPTDHLLLLLGGLGACLYMIFFLMRTDYLLGFIFLGLCIFLIYSYLQNSKPNPRLILSKDGIQVVGQPFVSWAMVHGLQIRPDIKGNEYRETFVFTNNGRIQEFPIAKLNITSWQLETLLEEYQTEFREQIIISDDREQRLDDRD
jgi:uncharacterized protein with PQ loop repeat